jgi:hypothetical protein
MYAAPRNIETQIFATLPDELRFRNRTSGLSKFVEGEFDSFLEGRKPRPARSKSPMFPSTAAPCFRARMAYSGAMKVLNWVCHILCAMLACAPLTFEARATASFEDGGSAHTGAGSGVGPKRRDAAAAAPSPRRGSMDPPRGAALAARGTAARQHSPPNAQARGRLARQANGLGGSAGAAAGWPSITGSHGAGPGPAGPPKLTASAPPAAPRQPVTRKDSTIGGPHAQGFGRVGGPAISLPKHHR